MRRRPIMRSNRLLFAPGERKQASRLLHGAQHYYTPCKRISTRRSDVASAASCWPEAGRVTPILSISAPVAGPTTPCGPRAPTPSRMTSRQGASIADSGQPVRVSRCRASGLRITTAISLAGCGVTQLLSPCVASCVATPGAAGPGYVTSASTGRASDINGFAR